mgnify:CR=1 FL=1
MDLELKTIFQFTEFEEYIPRLKNLIEFTGETILFAADKQRRNTFYVYEKCSVGELNQKERFFLYCNQLLLEENQNIKLAIKEKVFKLKSNIKIEHYIHKNQLAMESLLNSLIKQINPETNNELYQYSNEFNKIDCLKCIYGNLEKLLLFIEKEYNEYLNVNIMVPQRTMLMNEYAIRPKLDFVRDSLLAKEVNKELLKILFEPIVLLSTINIQNKITYYQFNYATEYILELSQLLMENQTDVTNEEIAEWLLDLNMNSIRFFDYETNIIQEKLDKCESDGERLELLYKKLKKFNQHRSRIKKSFLDKLPEIKVQICSWIEEEIEYRTKKVLYNSTNENIPNIINNKEKIHVGLSVAQLSWFVNLLVQSNIIKTKNQKDIIRFVADNFQTDNQKEISPTSLYSKYYNVESSTKETMKLKLIDLLKIKIVEDMIGHKFGEFSFTRKK